MTWVPALPKMPRRHSDCGGRAPCFSVDPPIRPKADAGLTCSAWISSTRRASGGDRAISWRLCRAQRLSRRGHSCISSRSLSMLVPSNQSFEDAWPAWSSAATHLCGRRANPGDSNFQLSPARGGGPVEHELADRPGTAVPQQISGLSLSKALFPFWSRLPDTLGAADPSRNARLKKSAASRAAASRRPRMITRCILVEIASSRLERSLPFAEHEIDSSRCVRMPSTEMLRMVVGGRWHKTKCRGNQFPRG
jgi:hypothetical protein